jgi:hypothetical protein
MVSVAVLPPRLPAGMAPPTGLGAADVFSWDESLNWQHNQPAETVNQKKGFLRKIGLTTQRQRKNPNAPNFVLREVPYDVWRKHYAKNAEGYYRGTHAPAEDCLLKPEDVAKWNASGGEGGTMGNQFTRGSDALPVYNEVKGDESAPGYEADYEEPARDEMVMNSGPPQDQKEGGFTADGKTTEEIIAEAKRKGGQSSKTTWKKGLERALLSL